MPGANRIVSSRFHVPPIGDGALATSCTDPLSMAVRFSLPSAKNPIDRLSGDQKGSVPKSVPARGRPAVESSRRNHNCGRPSDVAAKTTFCPSGEIASESGSVVGGVEISSRTSPSGGAGLKIKGLSITPAARATRPIASSESRARVRDGAGRLRSSVGGAMSASSISMRASPMCWSRCRGSFCRQRRRRRRMASGGIPWQLPPVRLGLENACQHLADRLAVERTTAPEHFVEHAPEGPHVRPCGPPPGPLPAPAPCKPRCRAPRLPGSLRGS